MRLVLTLGPCGKGSVQWAGTGPDTPTHMLLPIIPGGA
jgi:hypothetical protein